MIPEFFYILLAIAIWLAAAAFLFACLAYCRRQDSEVEYTNACTRLKELEAEHFNDDDDGDPADAWKG